MANWDIDWQPKKVITYGPEFNTLVTQFRSGARQYRKKQASARRRFQLIFEGASLDTHIDEILAFFDARDGQYETFTFPNYGQQLKGIRLALVNSNPDTITDSSSGFVKKGFETGGKVTIHGSGLGNDRVYDVHASTAVSAGTITLAADEELDVESVNALLRVYKTYDVRFASDKLLASFVKPTQGNIQTIELIEDL